MRSALSLTARSLWAVALITVLAACSEEDNANTQQDTSTSDTADIADSTSGDASDQDATQADTSGTSGTTEPDATEPDTTEPDTTEPDATEPDATEPDTTEPDATEPDTTDPDATDPDTGDTAGDLTEAEAWAFLDDCFADTPLGGVLTVVDLSGEGVFVRVAIDPEDRFGTSGTTPYDLIRFGAVRGADTVCVTDRDLLDYEVSHHNFDDYAVATVGADNQVSCRLHMTLEYGDPAVRTQSMTCALIDSGDVVYGPVSLDEAGCRSVPQGAGCIYRTETP